MYSTNICRQTMMNNTFYHDDVIYYGCLIIVQIGKILISLMFLFLLRYTLFRPLSKFIAQVRVGTPMMNYTQHL